MAVVRPGWWSRFRRSARRSGPGSGSYLLIAFAALLLGGRRRRRRAVRTDEAGGASAGCSRLTVLAGLVVGVVSVGGGGWWVWPGRADRSSAPSSTRIPPYVLNAMRSPERPRVLAIDSTGGVARYWVLADDRSGSAMPTGVSPSAARWRPAEQAEDLVIRLVAGTADSDIGPSCATWASAILWVTGAGERRGPGSTTPRVSARPAATSGHGVAAGTAGRPLRDHRPGQRHTRGATAGRCSTGVAGRVFKVGEPSDPRWRAEIDGRCWSR